MTAPTGPTVSKLGPGLLTIGPVATALDISCQLSAAWVKWDKDKEDDVPVLCGDTIAGAATYTAKLSGTIAQDLGAASSFVEYSWTNKGTTQPFVFVPSDADGKQVEGEVTIDPVDVGGDEVKKNMMSDFEWDCVGEPTISPVTAAAAA